MHLAREPRQTGRVHHGVRRSSDLRRLRDTRRRRESMRDKCVQRRRVRRVVWWARARTAATAPRRLPECRLWPRRQHLRMLPVRHVRFAAAVANSARGLRAVHLTCVTSQPPRLLPRGGVVCDVIAPSLVPRKPGERTELYRVAQVAETPRPRGGPTRSAPCLVQNEHWQVRSASSSAGRAVSNSIVMFRQRHPP